MIVKKPLDPNCRSKCALGFHLAAIQSLNTCLVGHNPMNFLVRAWSLKNWTWEFIHVTGRTRLGLGVLLAMQVLVYCRAEAKGFRGMSEGAWVISGESLLGIEISSDPIFNVETVI